MRQKIANTLLIIFTILFMLIFGELAHATVVKIAPCSAHGYVLQVMSTPKKGGVLFLSAYDSWYSPIRYQIRVGDPGPTSVALMALVSRLTVAINQESAACVNLGENSSGIEGGVINTISVNNGG